MGAVAGNRIVIAIMQIEQPSASSPLSTPPFPADLLRGIVIPPRPAIMVELQEKIAAPDCGVEEIAQIIGKDVALSAAILKAVNSSWFGLSNRLGSVREALGLLGIKNIHAICTQIALRTAMSGNRGASLERFWDSASETALISRIIADRLDEVSGDDAYTLGLFHDCGIPLLMQRFADYRQILKTANDSKYKTIVQVEDEHYDSNHATVGYFVCKSWHLPQEICQAILNHHNPDIWHKSLTAERPTKSMIAILHMAEHISHTYRTGHSHLTHAQRNDQNHYEWENIKEGVFEHFSLSEGSYREIHADILEHLRENA